MLDRAAHSFDPFSFYDDMDEDNPASNAPDTETSRISLSLPPSGALSDLKSSGSPRLVNQERARIGPSSSTHYYTQHAKASPNMSIQTLSGRQKRPVGVRFADPPTQVTSTSRSQEQPLDSSSTTLGRVSDELECGPSVWRLFCSILTFPLPPKLLKWMRLTSKPQQQAWREKIGLVFCIAVVSLFVGTFTLGLTYITCESDDMRIMHKLVPPDSVVIHGRIFNLTENMVQYHPSSEVFYALGGYDASFLFQNVNSNCKGFITKTEKNTVPMNGEGDVPWYFPCRVLTPSGHYVRQPNIYETWSPIQLDMVPIVDTNETLSVSEPSYGCHLSLGSRSKFYKMQYYAEAYYTWQDMFESTRRLAVYMGDVVDLDRLWLLEAQHWKLESPLSELSESYYYPKDMAYLFSGTRFDRKAMKCLVEIAKVGVISTESLGCIGSSVVLITSLSFIFTLVVVKFLFAMYYQWFLSWKMGGIDYKGTLFPPLDMTGWSSSAPHIDLTAFETNAGSINRYNSGYPAQDTLDTATASAGSSASDHVSLPPIILLITIYTEQEPALRQSLTALADSDYPDAKKLIIAICDGDVTKGGGRSTPGIMLSMMELKRDCTEMYSYVAVASKGVLRHNRAKIYSGYFPTTTRRVPIILIVKCGLPGEEGNRGKRDSQLTIMGFLQKVIFDERMTDLENELLLRMIDLTTYPPDAYELVLMVDADTRIYQNAVYHMVECFNRDSNVMGLCGETKIENKLASWVTRIQVFEYFISHHLTKAFESVFGGVTCLPGCFCMYRVKVAKGDDGYYLPLLANPDVVERYGNNELDTLHKKNLLLLGEDRYLSTLMLKTFPRRKQVYVSRAKCKTIVPVEFRALMDQRRRWINSTIHNLLELLLVRDLCGVFCISMQFVVLMELVGTVTLPAAMVFSSYLFILSICKLQLPLLPLALLVVVVISPGALVVLSGGKWQYFTWMAIYLCSLPVWNFILPLNAFWKFDEFRWGDSMGDRHCDEGNGKFDASSIRMMSMGEYFSYKMRDPTVGLFAKCEQEAGETYV